MKKISSFKIDHLKLLPGVYVSRKDQFANLIVTTFDIRMTAPNREPVLDTDGIHALEHLGATFLRNNMEWGSKVIYFGPMGCRTGFYLILADDLTSADIIPLLESIFIKISNYKGDIPGATSSECGNYTDMSLKKAQAYAQHFHNNTLIGIDESRLKY